MKNRFQSCLLFGACFCFHSGIFAQEPGSEYTALLKRVQRGDPDVDYRAFRIAGARALGSNASMIEAQERAKFKQLLASGDTAGALASAETFADRDAANAVAQFDAMLACQALQKPEEAAIHEKILNALMDSIQRSGDGKSQETAWFVVTTQEEYILIRRVLGLSPKSQSLVHGNGHVYDRLEAIDPKTNQKQYLWFNVDFDMGQYK